MTRPRCFTAHVKKSTFRDRLAALGALAALASAGLAKAQTSTGDTATPVPKVSVQGAAPDSGPQADGSAVDGYRVRSSTAAGPVLGNLAQLDTPYSINVMPQPLIENFQAVSPDKIFQLNPFTQLEIPATRGFNNIANVRGFSADQFYDGLRDTGPYEDLEDKERVEVLSGLSGFLHGGTFNPGGTVNFVQKRPTANSFVDVTAGDYDKATFYGHVDTGGTVGPNGVFDVHIAASLLLQFDASYSHRHAEGVTTLWINGAPSYPAAPDTGKNFGQKFTFMDAQMIHAGTNLTWAVSDNVTFRGAFRYADSGYSSVYTNDVIQADDTYNQTTSYEPRDNVTAFSGYGLIDITLDTFGISHKITAGFFGDTSELDLPTNRFQFLGSLTGVSLSSPQYVPSLYGVPSSRAKDDSDTFRNYVIADDIKLTEQLSALIGVTEVQISEIDFDTGTGAETYNYGKNKVTPAASLLYKPMPWLSTYFSYIQGLEEGSQASDTNNGLPVTNANELLAPVVDKQYELGLKAELGATLLTVALFDIDRASDVYVPNGPAAFTYTDDGREVHKGIEIGLTGKVTPDLTLYGGATFMHNRITNSPSDPELVGLRPSYIADTMAKLYAEYNVEPVPGLAATGNVAYTGSFYGDTENTQGIPAYTLVGLGFRYDTALYGTAATFRFNVDNITDKSYWLSGLYTGTPRTFAFSGQLRF